MAYPWRSFTAWVGHFDDSPNRGQISTLWQMVKVVPDPTTNGNPSTPARIPSLGSLNSLQRAARIPPLESPLTGAQPGVRCWRISDAITCAVPRSGRASQVRGAQRGLSRSGAAGCGSATQEGCRPRLSGQSCRQLPAPAGLMMDTQASLNRPAHPLDIGRAPPRALAAPLVLVGRLSPNVPEFEKVFLRPRIADAYWASTHGRS
jgi:hypothetical protein